MDKVGNLKVLHLIPVLTRGGAGRSLLALRRHALAGNRLLQERVISLQPADPEAVRQAQQDGMDVLEAPAYDVVAREIEACDLVLLHYWNTPELFDLLRADLPAMRLLIWLKVFGAHPPHVLTPFLLETADLVVATSPSTCRLPVCAGYERKLAVVPGLADFARLDGFLARPHKGFNVGYIGTVDYVKMHPRYVEMSAEVRVPGIRFSVCGTGHAYTNLEKRIRQQGAEDRFDLRGHVEDIRSVLEVLDVFGYPLCEDTYATSEKSLQEALYAGVPPVVFPHGGVQDLVEDGHTGLVVRSETAYIQALEYLYHHPEERARLGRNGAAYARATFDAEALAGKLFSLYATLMQQPRRKRSRAAFPFHPPVTVERRGAASFVEALGGTASWFSQSLYGQATDTLLAADEEIARSSPVLCNAGGGGLLHYRRSYPEDAYLRFWSGLVLKHQGRPALALSELSKAAALGFEHWRVSWYVAQTATKAGARTLAKTALQRVLDAAPDFEPALRMAASHKDS